LGYGSVWLILIGGTCISLLFSLLWLSLRNTRLKARQLEKIGRLLAEAQRIAHLGSWEYAAATDETTWSDEEFCIYGFEPGAGSPNYAVMLRESIHPDDRDLLDNAFQTCLQSGSIFETEHRLVRPDGSVRIVRDLAHPYFDASGKVVRYVGTTLDITERKRAEEALRESTSMLSLSQEIAHVGSWHLDLADNRLIWSDETYRIFGMAPQEFAATYEAFLSAVHPEDRAAVDAAYADSLREGRDSYESEHRVVRPRTGEVRHVLEKCTHVRDATGAIIQSVGMVQDITERKRAEEENLALERQVQHAQKLESLGVLAGGIAHDFNNLLMAILGNAGLALHKLSPMSPARDNIQEIEKASTRAAELAKQMLAYSGKGHFVIEPINAGILIEEMAQLLEVSISKNAVIKYNFASNLPSFDGDSTQIRQIIMNLITNASEAVGEKSGVIALSTGAMHCDRAYLDGVSGYFRSVSESPLPEGVYTYFEVADTGCGMDAATLAKIFDPFFTTKFTGRGLGMSAVLGIVRGHRGALNIYSEVGKGTTFKVLFPANNLPENGFSIRRPDEAAETDWRGSGTILIADDEESVCAVGQQILEHMGFHVLTASHGREALEHFREHADEIVCVLLDLTMPHMDGEETFREMRRLRPGVTVLLCSGYNEQDTIERFSGKGLAGFLQKPYSMGELRDKLRAILTGEGG
jgi:PAS domain S-box-containing protein